MIFGFLTKFLILVYFFRIKNNVFRNWKKSWKSIENIFFEIFLETKNFHWQINIKFSWKIEKFSENFSIFHENFILIFQWKFLVSPKISKNMLRCFFQDFFRFRKNIFYFSKKHIKIQNLSRNPKIALRKSCEHFKII